MARGATRDRTRSGEGAIAVHTPAEIKDELYHAYCDHDVPRMVSLYSRDAVFVAPEGVAEGREQISSVYEDFFAGFPDAKVTPWYITASDDLVVTEWTLTGTHTGPYLLPGGIETTATGRPVAVRGCCMIHVANDEIISHRHYYDQLELCSQLGFGAVSGPPPEEFPPDPPQLQSAGPGERRHRGLSLWRRLSSHE
jgi:steroid delta-isomerase-like uncharacterized protein